MANAINYAGNTYSGDVLEDLLVYTAQGNDTFKEGLIHIKPGVQKRYVLPGINLGQIVQANVPTPTSTNGAATDAGFNQYTLYERYLDPQDFMIYLEFNPRDFEEYWRFAQPEGELIFRELDPKVQATMLRLLVDKKDQYIGDAIWCARKGGVDKKLYIPTSDKKAVTGVTTIGGASAAGPMSFFDGAMVQALKNLNTEDANEKASGQIILAGDTLLDTGEKVEKALYAMWMACPKHVRKSDNLKFVMNWDEWDLYDQLLTSRDSKYVENSEINKRRFKGKPIVVINGLPEHTMFLGRFSTGMDSNLWMGVDYATDQESVKVMPLQNNSEYWFFQMRMKMAVNWVLPAEVVMWTAYKQNAAEPAA